MSKQFIGERQTRSSRGRFGSTVDTRDLDALIQRVKRLSGKSLDFGVMGPGGTPTPPHPNGNGLSIAGVAMIHEFGLGNVDERSFIRWVLVNKRREIRRALARGMRRYLAGSSEAAQFGLVEVGDELVRLARERITMRIPPPLGPWAAKSRTRDRSLIPLYDTRSIYDNIRWVIR